MRNPWLELPPQSPYILEIDRKSIEHYNRDAGPERRKEIAPKASKAAAKGPQQESG